MMGNPMMGSPMMSNPMMGASMSGTGTTGTTNQPSTSSNSSLEQRFNNLESRVTALENVVGTSSNYNSSNFQMM